MVIGATKFNLYLMLALILCLAAGCQTEQDKKPLAIIQLHLQALKDGTSMNKSVPIYRANPVLINVDTEPFLTEDDAVAARLVDTNGSTNGSFMICVKFNEMGTATLADNTSANPGKHFAIYCAWGKKLKLTRWLAAPQIHHMITTGQIMFTPDATREESQLIVDGLNNFIAAKKKRDQ